MTNHHDRTTFKACNTAHDRLVIGIGAIARQFIKLSKDVFEIIQRIRTLRMTRQLRDLPCT
ncbi:Uncharacterised protein [Vibrio cholerae]|nr:Uncharacterised protein [Vibrio cholerae]CSI82728.1 Uncharacterised protein [Vibrio cholerae]